MSSISPLKIYPSEDFSLFDRALFVAVQAHSGQKDKAGNPYILHPIAVSNFLDTEEEKAVALLHDVLEDNPNWDAKDIKINFGNTITEAVILLTHKKGTKYLDYLAALKNNPLALKVKLADIKHNSSEERLKNLPYRDQQYLSNKYKSAMEFLTS